MAIGKVTSIVKGSLADKAGLQIDDQIRKVSAEEGGEFEETGHVAVIVEVHEDKIRLAEQNVGHQIWPTNQNWCRELKAKVTKDGDYWIECSYSDATILGWMTQTDETEI